VSGEGYDKRNVIEPADDCFEVVLRTALGTDYGDDIFRPFIEFVARESC
jgi:hypothetical protein